MRITSSLTIGAFGLALPALGAAPQQFDLVCHTTTTTTAPDIKPIVRTDDTRMSVDLGRRRWCWHKGGTCSRALPVGDASGDKLKLDSGMGQGESRIEVDLSSGAFASLTRVRSLLAEITATGKGRCNVAPFTSGVF